MVLDTVTTTSREKNVNMENHADINKLNEGRMKLN